MNATRNSWSGYGQGGHSCYEFTSDEEKKKKGLKGFLLKKLLVSLQTIWSIVHGIVQSVKSFNVDGYG